MNSQTISSIPQQSAHNCSHLPPIQITPLCKNPFSESVYHSSQIKRPVMKFIDENPLTLDINCMQNNEKSFFSITQNNSQILNNFDRSNILNMNKSKQQEKYDSIKNYCLKKNDPDSYPLISYENFLLIDGICEKNTVEFESYKNFLLNKNASIELFSKFCTLLINRFISSKQNKSLKKYPKVVYQIIFDINNIYNYLSPDIVSDAKQSNMFMALISYQNKWNVLTINQNNNFCNYFLFNRKMDKDITFNLMNTVTQTIYPYHKFNFTVSDYSHFKETNQIILPFIIMEFFSRYKSNLPIDDEDYYYQTILILSEIMTHNLITK